MLTRREMLGLQDGTRLVLDPILIIEERDQDWPLRPALEVEEDLQFDEVIILFEDDYSWYEIHGELCLCVSYGSAADNNYEDNWEECPTGEHRHGRCTPDLH